MSSGTGTALTARAATLRDAFDRSFAEPRGAAAAATANFLTIRLGADPYALLLGEIGGLVADRKVVPVPGSGTMLLGIAGIRGALLPVYDLPALLGVTATGPRRWLAIAAGLPVALAFSGFDGHLRVLPEAIVPARAGGADHHIREFLRTDDAIRPIVHLPSVLEAIATLSQQSARKEER